MKLSKEKVELIVTLLRETELRDGQVAEIFKVSREQINHIKNGNRWSSVTGIKPKTGNDFREFTPTYKDKYDSLVDKLSQIYNDESNG
tara:strand:+ start:1319 stop:1582 length:264 start_codon:yes stop_codon:yes gene_type:complete